MQYTRCSLCGKRVHRDSFLELSWHDGFLVRRMRFCSTCRERRSKEIVQQYEKYMKRLGAKTVMIPKRRKR